MSGIVLLLLAVAVVNPARVRLLVGSETPRPLVVARGAGWSLGFVAVGAAIATPLLTWIQVAEETMQMAGAMIIMMWGAGAAVGRSLMSEVASDDSWSPIPVAYPILLTPPVVFMTIAYGATRGITVTVACFAVAFIASVGVAALDVRRPSLWAASYRMLSAATVAGGAALLIDGLSTV